MAKLRLLIQFLFVFFALTPFGFPQTPTPTVAPREDAAEKVLTEEIILNVSAFDRKGQFVADLKKEDLVILENGRLLQPTSVRRVPANVLIVLDTGGEIVYAKNTSVTREAAKNLIGALRAEDRFAVMQFHNQVETLAEWTSDKAQALDALDKKLGFGRRSVFYEALDKAILFFEPTPRENRHLVLITDGIDSFQDEKAKQSALKNLMSSEINVHVLSYTFLQQSVIEPKRRLRRDGEPSPKRLPEAGLLGLPEHKRPGQKAEVTQRQIAKLPRLGSINLDREMRRRQKDDLKRLETSERFLKTIADDANGEFFLPADYDEMLNNSIFLAETIDSQYVVTYVPKASVEESETGEPLEIEVSSKREGLRASGKRRIVPVKNRTFK